MSRYDFDDDERYVVIEKHEAGFKPFLIGLAVGAGVALLFAPRSGAATRRDIKRRAARVRQAAEDTVSNVTDTVVGTFDEARRRVEEQIDSARQAIDLKKEQVQRAMEAGRAAAEEARMELQRRIAESKASYNTNDAASERPAERPRSRARAAALSGDDEG
ncbi:MAG TPA: YtxH domain-containing protein [Gemmatimonadaceae bacterium]|nr:YtxH domain-containing protein [Gemmatimonadaceae bacterium]